MNTKTTSNTKVIAAAPLRPKSATRQLMTLPEQIAERIFSAIASGEYAPGDRIREESLAEEFEVSRGPVREALRILESDSVVRILPNKGAHVTQLTAKEVADIFEIRRTLSGAMVTRLSAEEATRVANAIEPDVRTLDALAQDPQGADEYFKTSFNLSRILRESCSNERLANILASLSRQTLRYTQLGLATPARRKESARNWRNLHKALKAGKSDVAAEAAQKLIEDSMREAISQLEERAPASSS
ncbi:GntR family transcriptional regulator [Variovorax sp. OV329]|uniref:GntR family transcriptional regulator n=1 Tax=Variovorax sp. OV329 TaxID=1882825 RepID=UPI0008DEDDA6|nr:GntR family transcriptional regulator [Variovorax sp. OV329]SFN51075.1 DNA-binding transcriptional regulator, GntR family [Variovorax sp. OV329]